MTQIESEWHRLTQLERSGLHVSDRAETHVVWGKGAPPSVKPLSDLEQVFFWSDQHGYYLEQRLWDASLLALRELQPDRLILGGDWLDLHVISRWNATQRARMAWYDVRDKVQDECDLGKRRLAQIRDVYGGQIDFTAGNHDMERLVPWLPEAEAIQWLGLEAAGVNCYNRAGFKLRPDFLVCHGNFVGISATKKHWQHFGGSGWHGHKHEYQVHSTEYALRGIKEEWTGAPCMVRRDYEYGPGGAGMANWSQGWLLGTFDRLGCLGTDVARWQDGKLLVRGELYH